MREWKNKKMVKARRDATSLEVMEYVVGDESHDLAWRPIRELVDEPGLDESVRRMARRWLGRSG